MDLTDYREQINNIDDEICRLFTERMRVVNQIGEFKREHDVPVSNSPREREVLARVSTQLPQDLEDFGRVMMAEDDVRQTQYGLIRKDWGEDFPRQRQALEIGGMK